MGNVGDQLRRRGLSDDGLLKLFRDAEKRLIDIVARSSSEPFRGFRARQLRAIDAAIFELQTGVYDWTQEEIPRLFSAGAEEAQAAINSFGEADFQMEFSGVSKNALKILAEEAFLEFGKTMVNMKTNANLAIIQRRKLQEKIIQGVIQGSSVARTQTQLIDLLRRDGLTALRARNGFGRRFSVEHYTNMLVRTQSMTAYNLGARTQMLGMGRRFALFPVIRPDIDGEDVCNEWERKKFVDLKKDPVPPQSTHPNCRHSLQPVSFAQLKRERPDLYRIAVGEFRAAAAR